MTLLIGKIERKVSYIATDSCWSWPGYTVDNFRHKFLDSPIVGLNIAGAGGQEFHDIVEEVLPLWAEKVDDVDTQELRRLTMLVRARTQFYKVGAAGENSLPEHNSGLIIGYHGNLWSMDETWSVVDFTGHGICADGTGAPSALMIMDALSSVKMGLHKKLKLVFKTVSEYTDGVGGKVHIRKS